MTSLSDLVIIDWHCPASASSEIRAAPNLSWTSKYRTAHNLTGLTAFVVCHMSRRETNWDYSIVMGYERISHNVLIDRCTHTVKCLI